MHRNLIEIGDSKRVEARNKFRENPVLEVYVESEDDIPFWKGIFMLHQMEVKIYPATKSKKRITRGKSEVLKKIAGENLLLCFVL